MRIRIFHQTHYHLDATAQRTVQYLRLTPREDRCQRTLAWRIWGPPSLVPWTDGFGNRVHLAAEILPHEELLIVVEGEIETENSWGVLRLEDGLPPMMFLRETKLTAPDEKIRSLTKTARSIRREQGDVPALHALMAEIAEKVAYQPGTTDVGTTAAEALAAGRGVCQDQAHIFIAAARTLSIPARYVSGYLASGTPEMASHAWAEAFIEGLGWVSFDPANKQSATEAYVRLAIGFDYADAAPLVGIRAGMAGEDLSVKLQIEQVQS